VPDRVITSAKQPSTNNLLRLTNTNHISRRVRALGTP